MRDNALIRQYTIYDHPRDYPDGFVVREWIIAGPEPRPGLVWVAPTLDGAREIIPPGSVCLHRDPSDDPVIVETWM